MLTKCINTLIKKENLTFEQCRQALSEILAGADPCQVAAFLVLLHSKGETAVELQAFVEVMQQHKVALPLKDIDIMDIVGTGGDNAATLNISTVTALVVASCGVKIAKHGNRAVSSKCGSADLLAALGIDIAMDACLVADCIKQVGIGFCFAPKFHPAMAVIKEIRTRLKTATTFNLLGPLLNPAEAQYYLMGVYDNKYLDIIANVLLKNKIKHAWVVHSQGLDELSLLGPAEIIEVTPAGKERLQIDPKDYGLSYYSLEDIQGKDVDYNRERVYSVLQGETGAFRDTIVFNVAAALYIAGRVGSLTQGISLARQQLDNGQARQVLSQWVDFSKKRKK